MHISVSSKRSRLLVCVYPQILVVEYKAKGGFCSKSRCPVLVSGIVFSRITVRVRVISADCEGPVFRLVAW